MNPVYDFKGQLALVTGASSGMGLVTAQAFAKAGEAVALVDRKAEQLEAATEALISAGQRAISIVFDVSDETQAKAAVSRTVAEWGRLDMAYNNAGILGPMCEMSEETAEGYEATQAVGPETTGIAAGSIRPCSSADTRTMRERPRPSIPSDFSSDGCASSPLITVMAGAPNNPSASQCDRQRSSDDETKEPGAGHGHGRWRHHPMQELQCQNRVTR
jgi:NAD(P)-dependent dehydrogenase (short-subunit alcohol dehydrogenase family)